MSSPPEVDLDERALHLLAGKYFQISAFVVLIYDHALTFGQEIDRIWKPTFSGATLLFLLNRYITPLEFVVVLDAFLDPRWTQNVCDAFVKFEGAATVALISICELTMILRMYALYGRSIRILVFLLILLGVQITISAIGLNQGFAIPILPTPEPSGCILTGRSALFPSLWLSPLITDTCIFILTLWRTRRFFGCSERVRIVQIIVRDGILYFFVIIIANLMNAVIYFRSPQDLKAIGASFSQLITSVMVSRLILNLRAVPLPREHRYPSTSIIESEYNHTRPFSASFLTLTLGNLGEEFDSVDNDSERDDDYLSTGMRENHQSSTRHYQTFE